MTTEANAPTAPGIPMFTISVETTGVVTCSGEACNSDCPIHGETS